MTGTAWTELGKGATVEELALALNRNFLWPRSDEAEPAREHLVHLWHRGEGRRTNLTLVSPLQTLTAYDLRRITACEVSRG